MILKKNYPLLLAVLVTFINLVSVWVSPYKTWQLVASAIAFAGFFLMTCYSIYVMKKGCDITPPKK
ncbi:MAG: hypothetical protein JST14_08260 [Bacteroidetes bacterium]|nr:hypothetical protein [Bacteroidota bacterium]